MPTNTENAARIRTRAGAHATQTIACDIVADIERGELTAIPDVQLRHDIARSLLKNRYPDLHAALVESVASFGWVL